MRRNRPIGLLAIAAALGLGACAILPGVSDEPPRPTDVPDLVETVPPSDPPVTGEVPADRMAAVLADLTARTGVDAADAQIVQAEAVVWPDGSLGCPERGMSYTQALVPGFHVIVAVDGREYDYRLSERGQVRLCEQPGPAGRPNAS